MRLLLLALLLASVAAALGLSAGADAIRCGTAAAADSVTLARLCKPVPEDV